MYKDDGKCLNFKEEDNELSMLKEYTPDFTSVMNEYVTYVKRIITDNSKQDEDEDKLEE